MGDYSWVLGLVVMELFKDEETEARPEMKRANEPRE